MRIALWKQCLKNPKQWQKVKFWKMIRQHPLPRRKTLKLMRRILILSPIKMNPVEFRRKRLQKLRRARKLTNLPLIANKRVTRMIKKTYPSLRRKNLLPNQLPRNRTKKQFNLRKLPKKKQGRKLVEKRRRRKLRRKLRLWRTKKQRGKLSLTTLSSRIDPTLPKMFLTTCAAKSPLNFASKF